MKAKKRNNKAASQTCVSGFGLLALLTFFVVPSCSKTDLFRFFAGAMIVVRINSLVDQYYISVRYNVSKAERREGESFCWFALLFCGC